MGFPNQDQASKTIKSSKNTNLESNSCNFATEDRKMN